MRLWKLLLFANVWICGGSGLTAPLPAAAPRPNVILVVADDLGYGDLGCYGQKQIRTPNLDRLAAQGMRFTQAYAGTTVCAPSRCSLVTGKHTGHTTIRGNRPDRNKPETPIAADEVSLGEVFKAAGYATALIGKWGVGENDSTGAPNRRGFDYFIGYLTQTAAHDYYPPFIWRNAEKLTLEANQDGRRGTYTHDLFMREALNYVRTNANRPFFLYLPITIPHANNEHKPNGMQVPDYAPYAAEKWPDTEKGFAAMITRMDSGIGQLLGVLKELGIEDKTLIVFTSDNGPHSEGGHDATFFNSAGGLRGIKRDLYEGGIRVPLIVRWPGKVEAGSVSPAMVAFWDFLPAFAELIGQPAPEHLDGVSFVPTLLNNRPVPHPPLYWEFHEKGFHRAVRLADWKGVSVAPNKPLELYNLASDAAEKQNVAAQHPDVVKQIEAIMQRDHVPNSLWPDNAESNNP